MNRFYICYILTLTDEAVTRVTGFTLTCVSTLTIHTISISGTVSAAYGTLIYIYKGRKVVPIMFMSVYIMSVLYGA